MTLLIQVQHSSDRQKDGLWHDIETTDDLRYGVERALVFEQNYSPRPIRILDRAGGAFLTIAEAKLRLKAMHRDGDRGRTGGHDRGVD